MIHYVYRITLLEPFDERKYYYGKHSGNLSDLGRSYFTSSKKVQKFIFEEKREYKIKIVKTFETTEEALKFEGKLHNRLDVAKHSKFFNQQNQTLSGKLDRTGLVTVKNLKTLEILTISVDTYQNNKKLYESLQAGQVSAKNLETGEFTKVLKSEFDKNKNLVGVNYGNNNLGNWSKGEVSCKDTNGNIIRVAKDVFLQRDDLVGIKSGISIKSECDICGKMIDNGNLVRHKNTHYKKEIWVTDNNNKDSFKVKEIEYYNTYFETHYINGPGSSLYKNGKKFRKLKKDGIIMEKRECPYCNKIIGNPNSNLPRHIKSKHKDKI